MKPFYLISVLFISIVTALPVRHRDNNGLLDNLLTSPIPAPSGIVAGVLDGHAVTLENVFDVVKDLLGIQDPRMLEEIIAPLKETLKETIAIGGDVTVDLIQQLLDVAYGVIDNVTETLENITGSTTPINTSLLHSISWKRPGQLH